MWETTYLHVLRGPDPVFTWVSGTGARPTLQALPDDLRPQFEAEFKARLAAAYPPGPTAPCCCRSAGSSSCARVGVRLHHVQVACPPGGEDEARRFYAEGLGLTEVDKPAELAGRGGVWFRGDAGVTPSCTSGSRTRSPLPARRTRPSCWPRWPSSTLVATRLAALGFEVDLRERHTFPGFERFHTYDAHGNRVEVLSR